VNYSFTPKPQNSSDDQINEDNLFINTFAHELSIRSSIYSIIAGSALGGLLGSLSRIIQITQGLPSQAIVVSNLFSVIVAVILSSMAIIFIARKSDAQSFVSVEDFWGGVLIGFLVGYSGTTFFESLTGVSRPTP